jgi:DNA adenine methylase
VRIARHAPAFERYYEPFIGGGAILFLLGAPGSVGGDVYKPLIAFWETVRDRPRDLIEDYATQWKALQRDLPGYFYVVRERFNRDQRPEDLNFLMRTCVNGIVRFSKRGDFNNSFHLSRRGMRPDNFAPIVREWSARLEGVEFRCSDFEQTVADARAGDFVYMDPPYAGNKQRYIGDLDVNRFYDFLESLNSRSIRWALSFDGARGATAYDHNVPPELYRRLEMIQSGYSAVGKVLNGPVEMVTESLYLNY